MTSQDSDAVAARAPAARTIGGAALTNGQVRAEIIRRLEADLFGGRRPESFRCGEWEILDYSSCLAAEWMTPSGPDGVYVKLPKTEIDRRSVFPNSDSDRRMAEDEHASLQYLARHWTGVDGDGRFIELLAFYRDLNAIVTRRAWGADFLHTFRRGDLRARLGFSGEVHGLQDVLWRVGTAVARFHESSARADDLGQGAPDPSDTVAKVARIAEDLRRAGVPGSRLAGLTATLHSRVVPEGSTPLTRSLKGLDVRNILLDSSGGRITFLDPGKMKIEPRQANLARLIVTIRILYWGTPWFAAGMTPAPGFEGVVLEAAAGDASDRLLRLYVVKELWKHWRAAYVALTRKRWPKPLELALARGYIDRFYGAEISSELKRMVS